MADHRYTELSAGWTFDPYHGAVYHFQHLPVAEARALAGEKGDIYAIEVINWTYATELAPPTGGKRTTRAKQVHLNTYYADCFASALALANHIALSSLAGEIAQDVVAIRRATEAEAAAFWAIEKQLQPVPVAIPEAP